MAKFKVVNVDQKIIKAIGQRKSLLGLSDNNDTVIFIKNKFDYNKVNEKSIFKRLNSDLDIGNELKNFKDDLFLSLTNINSLQGLNSRLPTIDEKALQGLGELSVSLKNDNKSRFYLEKISETQSKIYKLLAKIQEDLIDEQDTSIKEKQKEQKAVKTKGVSLAKETKKDIAKATGGGGFKIPNIPALASKLISIAGKLLKLAEVVLLLYYIIKNWMIADENIDEPGYIEKLVFAVYAGITEWVGAHIDLISWIVDKFVDIVEWISNNLPKYTEYLGDLGKFVGTIAPYIKFFPSALLAKHVLKPIIDWVKKNGAFGVQAGIYAVQLYRAEKDVITNEIPNGITFKILFGEEKNIENVSNAGLYKWNVLGKSDIKGSAKDLAQLATKEELLRIKEHDDIDEYDLKKIKEALAIKEENHISDEDVMKRRNVDVGLEKLLVALMDNITFFDNIKSWKKLWINLIEFSKNLVKTSPESTVITYFTNNKKPSTLNANHLLWNNNVMLGLSSSTDAPEIICNGILDEVKVTFDSENDVFWFTPYGTVVIQQKMTNPILSKKMVDRGYVKNHQYGKNGSLIIVNKVIGFFDEHFNFYKNVFNPADMVFKAIFKNNLITESNVSKLNKADVIKDDTKKLQTEESPKIQTPDKADPNKTKNYYNNTVKGLPSYIPQIAPETNQTYDQNNSSYKSISPNETKERVWKFFKNEFGMTDEQVAGIMGNLSVESGGFNPKHIRGEHWDKSKSGKNDGMSGGLCQWHDVNGKGRLSALKKFAGGRDWRDLDVQLQFLKHELNTTHKAALNAVLKSNNAYEATRAWVYQFERPANKEKETLNRYEYAKGFLKLYGKDNGQSDTQIIPETNEPIPTGQHLIVEQTVDENGNVIDEKRGDAPMQSNVSNNDYKSVLEKAKRIIAGTTYSQPMRTEKGYYDCSSFVTKVLKECGFNISGVPTTHHYDDTLKKIGFTNVGKASANNHQGVKPGDILLKKGKHIMIYDGNNNVIEANGWNGSHNGVNRWGSLHSKNEMYEVWRNGSGVIPSVDTLSNLSNEQNNNSLNKNTTYKNSINSEKLDNSRITSNSNNNIILLNQNNSNLNQFEYEGMSEELFKFKSSDIIRMYI